MKYAELSSASKTGAAKFLASSSAIIFLFALLIISASAADSGSDINPVVLGADAASAYVLTPFVGPAAHTADVVLTPEWTRCQANNDFKVTITNNGPAALKIIEIYNNTYPGNVEFTPPPHTNFACGPAPDGWQLNNVLIGSIKLCQYFANETTFLNASMSEVFNFSAKTTGQSNYSWGVITRDVNGTWIAHYPSITVDCTPPNTTKTFDGPQIVKDGVEWIDGVTKVVLKATDSIGPHDSGVNKTEYRETLVNNDYCYHELPCSQAAGTDALGGWKTYIDPFSLNQSCHLLEYKSIDGVGNVENVKKNCFFVDKTKPTAEATTGYPRVKCSGDDPVKCDWWIQDHVTQINISCSNGIEEPHPSPLDKIEWRVKIDDGNWSAWDEAPADQVKTITFGEDSVHYLEYKCNDAVEKQSNTGKKIYRVDSTPPVITKKMFGKYLDDCPPKPNSGDKCYVANNGESGVSIGVVDPDPTGHGCNVGNVSCTYRVDWIHDNITETVESGEFKDYKEIVFKQDSTHKLYLNCSDKLGNKVSDVETFLVDSTPPVTNKTYGKPFVGWWYPKDCGTNDVQCGWADWINSKTPVTLTATDNKVGVNKTYWRNLLVNNEKAGENICSDEKFKELYCKPQYYNEFVNLSTPWNEYTGQPFYKPEESCHVIEYFSVDRLGNEENKKWQCVFVDNTAPQINKTIGQPKVVKQECVKPEDIGGKAVPAGPRTSNAFAGSSLSAMSGEGPCANATQPDQCSYLNVTDLPNYAKDTIKAQLNVSLDTIPAGCDKVLILSSGNPDNNGTDLSTGMGHPGCGANPDGYGTHDCVILENYTSPADVSILAISSEWPEYKNSIYTDWMQVSDGASVNMSINNWKNVITLPIYGPSISGTQTLASKISSGSAINLRVADSSDSAYDTTMLLVPLACGVPTEPAESCGDGIVQQFLGEECDLGAKNGQPGSNCSANCKAVEGCNGTVVTKTFITQQTPITLTCKDVFPHPVDHVNISYRYRVGDDCKKWGNWTDWIDPASNPNGYVLEKTFTFPEDSCHELEYYCTDGLGNTGPIQSEIDVVDSQAPVINKTIVGPKIEAECPPIEVSMCNGFEECFAGNLKKDFFITGRYGNNGNTGAWELAIWNVSGGSETVKAEENYVWSKNQLVNFSIRYYANNGSVVYKLGNKTLQWTYSTNKAFDYIIPFVKGKSGVSSELSDLVLNGKVIGNLNSGSGYEGRRISISDADQTDGFTLTGKVKFNWGSAQNEIPGFHVFAMNTHDRENKSTCTYIDGVTNISVDATDPEPHPVDDVICNWDYDVVDDYKTGQGQNGLGSQFIVHFPEESKHRLTIECKDKLNNTVKDVQTYLVDKTPPVTKKKYEGPQYPQDDDADDVTHWINNKTNITFSVEDTGPHKSGINATYTKVSLVDDKYCWDQELCQTLNGSNNGVLKAFDQSSPKLYTNIPDESCHLIEYYSVDNVNKTEETNRQCVFVDNTGPLPNKTIGKPAEKWDGSWPQAEAVFHPDLKERCWGNGSDRIDCWKVTTVTPITMNCSDPDPHPVGHSSISFKLKLDSSIDLTEEYCEKVKGGEVIGGYCVVEKEAPITIYFGEESEHNLEFYCTDALGNKGPVDDEKFKVDGTAFDLKLYRKWNLISVPFVLLNSSVDNVFKDVRDNITAVWTYDNGQWLVWTPGPAPDTLEDIRPGWGYWVLTNDDLSIKLGGALFSPILTPPQKQLVEGWNLIGYYGVMWQDEDWQDPDTSCSYFAGDTFRTDSYCALNSLTDTKEGHPRWSSLWTYVNPDCTGGSEPWRGINSCTNGPPEKNKMQAGYGYWIEMDIPDMYAPSSVCQKQKDCVYFTPA